MVDAPVSKSGDFGRAGSIPVRGTNMKWLKKLLCYFRGGCIPPEWNDENTKEGSEVYCRDCGEHMGTIPYKGSI